MYFIRSRCNIYDTNRIRFMTNMWPQILCKNLWSLPLKPTPHRENWSTSPSPNERLQRRMPTLGCNLGWRTSQRKARGLILCRQPPSARMPTTKCSWSDGACSAPMCQHVHSVILLVLLLIYRLLMETPFGIPYHVQTYTKSRRNFENVTFDCPKKNDLVTKYTFFLIYVSKVKYVTYNKMDWLTLSNPKVCTVLNCLLSMTY